MGKLKKATMAWTTVVVLVAALGLAQAVPKDKVSKHGYSSNAPFDSDSLLLGRNDNLKAKGAAALKANLEPANNLLQTEKFHPVKKVVEEEPPHVPQHKASKMGAHRNTKLVAQEADELPDVVRKAGEPNLLQCDKVTTNNARQMCETFCANRKKGSKSEADGTLFDKVSVTRALLKPANGSSVDTLADYCCSCDQFGCVMTNDKGYDMSTCKEDASCIFCGWRHPKSSASSVTAMAALLLSVLSGAMMM